MSIGALAQRLGLATHVLRHWETMGLLRPARDRQVAVILRYKDAGLDLTSIRAQVAAIDPTARHDILREGAEALRARIAAAQASLERRRAVERVGR